MTISRSVPKRSLLCTTGCSLPGEGPALPRVSGDSGTVVAAPSHAAGDVLRDRRVPIGLPSEEQGAGDDEVGRVRHRLPRRRSGAVTEEPGEKRSEEATVVEPLRRIPQGVRGGQDAQALKASHAGAEEAGGQEEQERRGPREKPTETELPGAVEHEHAEHDRAEDP